MRKYGRVDASQAAIVGAFNACGLQTLSLADVGDGCPDLLVCSRDRRSVFLVECKTPRKGTLTDAQAIFHASWPVAIVESAEGAVALLGGLT